MAELAIVEQSILDYFKNATGLVKKDKMQIVISDLEKLLNEMTPINENLKETFLLVSHLKRWYGYERYPSLYYIYNNSSYQYIQQDIKNKETILFEDALIAYERMVQIRQLLTKEKITYRIGAGSRTKEKIFEATLSFDQLQPRLYLERRADGYAIRLKISQSSLKDLAGDKVQQISSENPSTLYSKVFRWYTGKRLEQGNTKGIGNWGNFYEAYRYLLSKYDGDNNIIPPDSDLIEAFSAALSGGGRAGSFIKGGDVDLEQDKAAIGGYPSLTNIDTILSILKELIEMLKEFINGDSKGLSQLLIGRNINKKTLEKAQNEAKQEILNNIQNFLTK